MVHISRRQQVKINEALSKVRATILSVPQGSVLGTVLFTLLISDLPTVIKSGLTLMFADDTQIIISGPPGSLHIFLPKLADDLDRILTWMTENRLGLNLDKTLLMLIGAPRVVKALGPVSVTVRGITVNSVTSMKTLGLHLDQTLSWTDHVTQVTTRANSSLWSLYPIQRNITVANRKLMVSSFLLPIVHYMAIIWDKAKKSKLKEIESLLRRSARYVLLLKRHDNVKQRLTNELKWLLPKHLYEYEVISSLFHMKMYDIPYFRNLVACIDDTADSMVIQTRRRAYARGKDLHRNSFEGKVRQLLTEVPPSVFD